MAKGDLHIEVNHDADRMEVTREGDSYTFDVATMCDCGEPIADAPFVTFSEIVYSGPIPPKELRRSQSK